MFFIYQGMNRFLLKYNKELELYIEATYETK